MRYEGFNHTAEELSAFGITVGIFVISLKDGKIVRHEPESIKDFHNWLLLHGVREVGQA